MRATQRLLKHLGRSPEPTAVRSTGVLGDWYANTLFIGHQRLVLAISAQTLLSVLLPLRDLSSFPAPLRSAVAILLARLGVSAPSVAAELREMEAVVFAPTASRRVLGSMADLAFMASTHIRAEPGVPLREVALRLSEAPCSPLGHRRPCDAARTLLSQVHGEGVVQ